MGFQYIFGVHKFNLRGNRGKCYLGPHPVMVSGLGIKPGLHLQIGFPWRLVVHTVLGPQGLGLQLSGPHPVMVSGCGIKPGLHLQIRFPWLLVVHTVPGPQGLS